MSNATGTHLVIDPGLRAWAYSVFAEDDSVVESETIKFNTKLSQEKRLFDTYSLLSDVVSRHKLTNITTEYQFVNTMSNIVGVIMAVAGSDENIKFKKITPSAWKKAGFGKGNIDEELLSDKIIDVYPQAQSMSEHERDCLGMYIAYKKTLENEEGGKVDAVRKSPKRNKKK